jgi:hypothetical protein
MVLAHSQRGVPQHRQLAARRKAAERTPAAWRGQDGVPRGLTDEAVAEPVRGGTPSSGPGDPRAAGADHSRPGSRTSGDRSGCRSCSRSVQPSPSRRQESSPGSRTAAPNHGASFRRESLQPLDGMGSAPPSSSHAWIRTGPGFSSGGAQDQIHTPYCWTVGRSLPSHLSWGRNRNPRAHDRQDQRFAGCLTRLSDETTS